MGVPGALKHVILVQFQSIPSPNLAEICDQCETLEEGPQCVKWCPKDALEYISPDQRAQETRHKIVKDTIQFPEKAKDPR